MSLNESKSCVPAERQDEEPEWDDLVPPWGQGTMPMEDYLRELARVAGKNGCGNCGEQSAMAFVYLLNGETRPIDWMCLEKGDHWFKFMEGDHAFVVVGRSAFSNDDDPATWGPEAIVCDAWHEDIYPPNKLIPLWKHKPKLIYRVEGRIVPGQLPSNMTPDHFRSSCRDHVGGISVPAETFGTRPG